MVTEFKIAPGIEGMKEFTVTADKLAPFYGSGTLDVLATPSMIAMMEQTAMESVARFLPEPYATVGTEVSVQHLRATLPGQTVCCSSKLILSAGRKLVFEVYTSSESGQIGKGTHTRYIVDKLDFIASLNGNNTKK